MTRPEEKRPAGTASTRRALPVVLPPDQRGVLQRALWPRTFPSVRRLKAGELFRAAFGAWFRNLLSFTAVSAFVYAPRKR